MPIALMFTGIQGIAPSKTLSPYVSMVLHGMLLLWILQAPKPILVRPSSVVRGVPGGSVTRLYWLNQSAAGPRNSVRKSASAFLSQPTTAAKHLIWNQRAQAKAAYRSPDPLAQGGQQARSTMSDRPGQVQPAGSPFGSLSKGSLVGWAVRPALPIAAFDPVLGPGDLPAGMEGDEVIEITIDESGTIVHMAVLKSLGPSVDAMVLAVLQNWHFRPATRDGVAIPSKQDVHYHFRPG